MKQPSRGTVERPDQAENVAWQTRLGEPTEWENRLGDALEQVFAAGIEDLPGVVRRLNEMKVLAPDGQPWSEASFEAEMARLGR